MRFLAPCLLLALFGLLSTSSVQSQEKKENTKIKGFLPPGFGKIGLSDEQKIQIYKIQGKYREDVKKLEDKIQETKAEERREIDKLLTAEQRKKLIEVITGGTEPKKDTKDANP